MGWPGQFPAPALNLPLEALLCRYLGRCWRRLYAAYVAYRKTGYSKQLLSEHESDITLHKAAKQYFDAQGVEMLPTVKSLNAEYAALMAEKKAAYSEYRKARKDMKELLTAEANIDRFLGTEEVHEEPDATKEKEAEQR